MAKSLARYVCIAAVACIAILGGGALLLKMPSLTPAGTGSSQPEGTDATLPKPLLVQNLAEMEPSYSLDEAAKLANLIVTGTVASEGTSLLVKPVHEEAAPPLLHRPRIQGRQHP